MDEVVVRPAPRWRIVLVAIHCDGGVLRRVHFRGHGRCRHQAAERCNFDRLRPELDVSEAKAPPDDPAIAKELLDLMRMSRRSDVEVFRATVKQKIANTYADKVCDVMVFV